MSQISPLTGPQERLLEILFRRGEDANFKTMFEYIHDMGVVPTALLNLATNPTTTDTVTIGSDVYEFVTASGNVADDANIAVAIGGTVADSRTNLVAAINSTDPDNQHANINNVADDAAALANGEGPILAAVDGSGVRIWYADGPGGTKRAGNPSIALAETLTDGTDAWDLGLTNLNQSGGRAAAMRRHATTSLTVLAGMISDGSLRISLGFQPSFVFGIVEDASGNYRPVGANVLNPVADGIDVTLTDQVVEIPVPLLAGQGDGGTWTKAVSSAGAITVARDAADAASSFWVEVPAPMLTDGQRALKPTGATTNYQVATADVEDVLTEVWKVTQGADGAPRTITRLFGESDADYDEAHNTAAERGDDTAGPELHKATVVDAGTPAYLVAGEHLLYRFYVDGDSGPSGVVTLTDAVIQCAVDGIAANEILHILAVE